MPDPVASVVATAPVRVADVGGWTDTWFGAPGQVCHLAVGPGVRVEAALVESDDPDPVLHPVDLGAPYVVRPDPEVGWERPQPGRHPLLERALAEVIGRGVVPAGQRLEVTISSAVPPGASLGTSASVLVALLAAVDALVGAPRSAGELARAAHRLETTRVGRESGVQDHWAAAFGGAGLLTVSPYPDTRRDPIPLEGALVDELAGRVVTVVFGPHDSSSVHHEVIDAIVSCSGAAHDQVRQTFRRLATLADRAAGQLREGSVDGWAAVLSEATEAQRQLHPGLIGPAHRRAIAVAEACGAAGWKVNGAGGDGGSLTVVAASAAEAPTLRAALSAADPAWVIPDLAPAAGVAVTPTS